MKAQSVRIIGALLAAFFLVAASAVPAGAQTAVESSAETRFQWDLQVPAAALAAYLPPGWTSNIAAQGAAKDCNLRLVFIDRVTVNGPDGRMVAVLCDVRPQLPADDEEREYSSYCGNYTFDGTMLVTRVDAASDRSRLGGDQIRRCQSRFHSDHAWPRRSHGRRRENCQAHRRAHDQ